MLCELLRGFWPCHFSNLPVKTISCSYPADSFSHPKNLVLFYAIPSVFSFLCLRCCILCILIVVLNITTHVIYVFYQAIDANTHTHCYSLTDTTLGGSVGGYNPNLGINSQPRTTQGMDASHTMPMGASSEPVNLPKPAAMFDAINGSGAPLLSLAGGNPNMPGSVLRAPSIGSFQMGTLQGTISLFFSCVVNAVRGSTHIFCCCCLR